MDRQRQLHHLVQAEAHVASSLRRIARQQEIIAAFRLHGDAEQAEAILVTFEQTLRLHEDHLAQIRNELWLSE
jgi:ATP-dependent protease HslVU (ClpYQ) peptidase subunit